MSRLSEEMKIIPKGAWYTALLLCVVFPVLVCGYFVFMRAGRSTQFPADGLRLPPIPALIVGGLICLALFVYILILGYIAQDARRRGMRVLLWVLLAIFIPNAIGIILYFILREPLLRTCPQCGTPAKPAFAFCSSCGAALARACPSCRSAVELDWAHCARCGTPLNTK